MIDTKIIKYKGRVLLVSQVWPHHMYLEENTLLKEIGYDEVKHVIMSDIEIMCVKRFSKEWVSKDNRDVHKYLEEHWDNVKSGDAIELP